MEDKPSSLINALQSELRAKTIAIVGCTASGKSALADRLACNLDGEIISADSMQIYRGMDIGTAKIPLCERSVPYHCIDIVNPGQAYSAALFQEDARAALDDIHARGKLAIICGGTGFYVRSALDSMDFAAGEQQDNPTRNRYKALLEEIGAEALHELLRSKDPQSASEIHPNNSKRVIRALEMFDNSESYYLQHLGFSSIAQKYPACWIGIDVANELLYDRINQRVDTMISMGLLDEVRSLLDMGFRDGITASQAIGYKEFVPVLDAGLTCDSPEFNDAVETVKQSSRRYAKRQRSWFKAERRIQWIAQSEYQNVNEQYVRALEILGTWLKGQIA